MKNVFKLIGVIALVAVIGFGVVACGDGGGSSSNGKNDKTDGNDDTETGGSLTNVKNAKVFNMDDTLFTRSGKVFLWAYGKNDPDVWKEVGKITNGKLSFTLPDLSADVSKGFLAAEAFNIFGFVDGSGINASPPDAKMLLTDDGGVLYVVFDNDIEGALVYGSFDGNQFQCRIYTYLDKKTTVTGTNTDYTVNCTYTKGWNTVYVFDDNSLTKFSTDSSIVNTAKMKWYFSDDW